jgi:hypothetical protein
VHSILQRSGWPDEEINSFIQTTLPVAESAREAIVKSDALRSFLFILLAAGALWCYLKYNFFNKKLLLASLAVLILLDMLPVDRRYLNEESFAEKKDMQNPFALQKRPHSADLAIMQDPDPNFRVWNTLARLDQDAISSYFYKSLGGYHGAKFRRYQDLIDFHIYQRNFSVINMLNTKYIVTQSENGQPIAYPNPDALGNAWFVQEYRFVANADSEITALRNFNPESTTIVDERFKDLLGSFIPKKDSLANIVLVSYKPNELVYESNSSSEALAVFSEIYYPHGWNAYVDGKLMPHFRVNYVLRAMRIPAGKHQVQFTFEPEVISKGEKISAASLILLFLLCGAAVFSELKRKKLPYPAPKEWQESG